MGGWLAAPRGCALCGIITHKIRISDFTAMKT